MVSVQDGSAQKNPPLAGLAVPPALMTARNARSSRCGPRFDSAASPGIRLAVTHEVRTGAPHARGHLRSDSRAQGSYKTPVEVCSQGLTPGVASQKRLQTET